MDLKKLKQQRLWPPRTWVLAKKEQSLDVYATAEAYTEAREQFIVWTRLMAAFWACSYLETFLLESAQCALESDPGASLGYSRAIDGVAMLKRGTIRTVDSLATITKGTWPDRIGGYAKLVGRVPVVPPDDMKLLERLRKLRNSLAHEAGSVRGASATAPVPPLEVFPATIGEKPLLNYLRVVDRTALTINGLAMVHIGSYETLHAYHVWRGQNPDAYLSQFRTCLRAMGTPPSLAYLKELKAHYDAA